MIDRTALQRELASAITMESERHNVDEMKKRAITTAKSYDEFKNLVACANQAPLSRHEQLTSLANGGPMKYNRRVDASAGTKRAAAPGSTSSQPAKEALVAQVAAASSPGAFDTAWRRLKAHSDTDDDAAGFRCAAGVDGQVSSLFPWKRKRLHGEVTCDSLATNSTAPCRALELLSSSPAPSSSSADASAAAGWGLRRVFASEVDSMLFSEIVACCASAVAADPSRCHSAVTILHQLSQCGRFEMAAQMLSDDERCAVRGILDAAQQQERGGTEAGGGDPLAAVTSPRRISVVVDRFGLPTGTARRKQ